MLNMHILNKRVNDIIMVTLISDKESEFDFIIIICTKYISPEEHINNILDKTLIFGHTESLVT